MVIDPIRTVNCRSREVRGCMNLPEVGDSLQ
jgi:hypothetical protein